MNIAIISINVYIVFTLLFFIIKYFKVDKDTMHEPNKNWMIYYFILSFFVILIQNTYYSSLNEGETKCVIQPLTLFIYTILPVCLILGPIIILLVVMNLNRIFANTFGLLLAPKIVLDARGKNAVFFYNDPNVLLQEIEPTVLFEKQNLQTKLNLLVGEDVVLSQQTYETIIEQYHIKQNVGYFVWLLFTGIVTSLVSANTILLQDCIIE